MKKLDEIAGKNPFRVPDNYFEDVTSRILSQTMNAPVEAKVVRFRFRRLLAVAASIAGLTILTFISYRYFNGSDHRKMANEITTEAVIDDIDINSLEENVVSAGIADQITAASKNEIIDDLLHEGVEVNEIYERL